MPVATSVEEPVVVWLELLVGKTPVGTVVPVLVLVVVVATLVVFPEPGTEPPAALHWAAETPWALTRSAGSHLFSVTHLVTGVASLACVSGLQAQAAISWALPVQPVTERDFSMQDLMQGERPSRF